MRPYQALLVLLYYEGLLAKCVAIVSSCFRITCEFQKQFPSWNFLVPREELFGSNGGTLRSLGRKGKTFRTYDLILPESHPILPKFHCLPP